MKPRRDAALVCYDKTVSKAFGGLIWQLVAISALFGAVATPLSRKWTRRPRPEPDQRHLAPASGMQQPAIRDTLELPRERVIETRRGARLRLLRAGRTAGEDGHGSASPTGTSGQCGRLSDADRRAVRSRQGTRSPDGSCSHGVTTP